MFINLYQRHDLGIYFHLTPTFLTQYLEYDTNSYEKWWTNVMDHRNSIIGSQVIPCLSDFNVITGVCFVTRYSKRY